MFKKVKRRIRDLDILLSIQLVRYCSMKFTTYVKSYDELYEYVNRNLKKIAKKRGERFRDYMARKLEYVYKTVTEELRSLYMALEIVESSGEFYVELFRAYVGVEPKDLALKVKKYLSTAKRVYSNAVAAFRGIDEREGNKASELFRKSAGRILSFYKRLSSKLGLVKQYFGELSKMPDVRGDYVVVIAGVPQVGKSTLLSKLTRAKPEIGVYPFTTKTLVAGHINIDSYGKIVLLDSPGILDSPIEEKNLIELKAILAIKHLADHVVYMFATHPDFYYTLEEQLNVYRSLMKLLSGKRCTPVLNKVDLLDQNTLNDVINKIEKSVGLAPIPVSAYTGYNLDLLKKLLIEAFIEKAQHQKP